MNMRAFRGVLLLAASVIVSSVDIHDLYTTTVTGWASYDGRSPSANGHCSLGKPGPAGIPAIQGVTATAGVSSEVYALNTCGACLKISDPKGSVRYAYVNDECTSCSFGDLNLGVEGTGTDPISWTAVPCPLGDTPVRYVFQGSNHYYLKVKVTMNRCPIKAAWVQLEDHSWKEGKHTSDDYYIFEDRFAFPINFMFTSIFGESIYDRIGSLSTTAAPGLDRVQFAHCGPSSTDTSVGSSSSNGGGDNSNAQTATPAPAASSAPQPAAAAPLASSSANGMVILNETHNTVSTNGSVQTTQTCITTVTQLASGSAGGTRSQQTTSSSPAPTHKDGPVVLKNTTTTTTTMDGDTQTVESCTTVIVQLPTRRFRRGLRA